MTAGKFNRLASIDIIEEFGFLTIEYKTKHWIKSIEIFC